MWRRYMWCIFPGRKCEKSLSRQHDFLEGSSSFMELSSKTANEIQFNEQASLRGPILILCYKFYYNFDKKSFKRPVEAAKLITVWLSVKFRIFAYPKLHKELRKRAQNVQNTSPPILHLTFSSTFKFLF